MGTIDKLVVNHDFQGWPEYAQTIRDIISALGAKLNKETGKWEINDDESLDVIPTTLEDDGMGYGVNEEFIIECNFSEDKKHFTFFRDRKESVEESDRFKKLMKSIGETLIEKNKKYGDSALSPKNILFKGTSADSITIRLDDKISRVLNSEKTDTGYKINKNDIFDIIGYCMLYEIGNARQYSNIQIPFEKEVEQIVSASSLASNNKICKEVKAMYESWNYSEDFSKLFMEKFNSICNSLHDEITILLLDIKTLRVFCTYAALMFGYDDFSDQID